MKLKRILHIIFYGMGALICLYIFSITLGSRSILTSTSNGIPFLSVFIFVFLVPAILFTYQAIKYDKRSAIVIMILTICAFSYLAYEEYLYYDMRKQMEVVMGPYPEYLWQSIFIKNWPFLALLGGSLLLYPREKNKCMN